ncbi:MAG: PHB depolymerase family esterase [Acetobacteraceae bacterium]
MKWSRELRIARRTMRTAIKAASAMAGARTGLPSLHLPAWGAVAPSGPAASLIEVPDFGSNPGRLSMLVHLPPAAPAANAPLIVLLHGCGQTASSFAAETGWLAVADQLGVPLVLPEQQDENNRGRCFNWFRPVHTGRGLGEALSIRQMVAAAIEQFGSDPRRVFITGLSAGGAMTAAMLAAYPDVFAGGAVVAGLPVGAASSTAEALRRMGEAGPDRPASAWAEEVRRAGPVGYPGPWPRLSIWHGDADRVVDPANGGLLATQWAALFGLDPAAPETAEFLNIRRDRWTLNGTPVVERWRLPGMAHAWPSRAAVSIADFWGIAITD